MRKRGRVTDLEREAQASFYLVELTWNDGVRTVFVIQSRSSHEALQAVEVKALNMWEGYIMSSQVNTIPIPEAVNLPAHVYTDHSGYHEPVEQEAQA